MNHNISTVQKYLQKKIFISSYNSVIQFNFISFNSYKNSRKITIKKFIFQVRNLQFYKNWSLLSIMQEYLQNVD